MCTSKNAIMEGVKKRVRGLDLGWLLNPVHHDEGERGDSKKLTNFSKAIVS